MISVYGRGLRAPVLVSSVPCANPPVVAIPTCPGGTGYVPVIARALALGGAV